MPSATNNMNLVVGNEYPTRDGGRVKILANTGTGMAPIVALKNGSDVVRLDAAGRAANNHGDSVAMDPVVLEGYINVYSSHIKNGKVKLPKSGEKKIYATAEQARAAITGQKGGALFTAKVTTTLTPLG